MNEQEKAAHKKKIEAAVGKFLKKNDPSTPRRKNQKPEAKIEADIYKRLNEMNWDVDFYESSTFGIDENLQDYKVVPGHSDLGGNTDEGIAAYIEVKNTGCRNNLSENQRIFLERKIETNCFAICADSFDLVIQFYTRWKMLPSLEKKSYLLSVLPVKKKGHSDMENPFEGLD